KVYQGEAAPLLDWQQKYDQLKGTTLYNDIKRFDNLSEGYLIEHPDKSNVIGDGRYAMLPTAMSPLWGIKVDTTKPHKHLPFKTFRDATPAVRNTYLDMLLRQ
ncbi:MAG: metal-dependent hydrolase, partial [Aliifodinibius sp.]|nr:metal-dependent hydrolase [Fodinibius sp.]NIV10307.1 metal-dependent hydrolase [Fodinibius sp.]NIY23949.1 metal-dependent hydrolase [Fodinibius sp.]